MVPSGRIFRVTMLWSVTRPTVPVTMILPLPSRAIAAGRSSVPPS
jgi:hypothetical protein